MSEENEIKRLGAIPVKNSGRGRGTDKGDAVMEPFLVDVKEYTKSFSVSRNNWTKIQTDALKNGGREPMLVVALGQDELPPIRLWIISEYMGRQMYEAWKEKYK